MLLDPVIAYFPCKSPTNPAVIVFSVTLLTIKQNRHYRISQEQVCIIQRNPSKCLSSQQVFVIQLKLSLCFHQNRFFFIPGKAALMFFLRHFHIQPKQATTYVCVFACLLACFWEQAFIFQLKQSLFHQNRFTYFSKSVCHIFFGKVSILQKSIHKKCWQGTRTKSSCQAFSLESYGTPAKPLIRGPS